MNPIDMARTYWKWGLLALLAFALTLSWGHSGSQTAQAAGPEMSLGAKGAITCDSPDKPTKCWATYEPGDPKAWEFQITVNANVIPVGGYGAFQSEVLFGGLTYNQRTYCEDYGKTGGDGEVTWPDGGGFCMRQSIPGGVRHADLTFIIPPLPKSNHVGELVQLDAHCPSVGSFTVTLTVAPASNYGAVYLDLDGDPVYVKSAAGNADSLLINCVLPASEINITKLSRVDPQPVPGACFEVWDEGNTTLLFSVCDNDFQAAMPDSDPRCEVDGTPECEDLDPANGSVRVAVVGGNYSLVESKPPMNHTPDPAKKPCNAKFGKCELTFTNTVINAPTPWLPEDVNGDNAVSGLDFFAVLNKFGVTKP